MRGLLAAFMNAPPDDEAGFNAWYDEEHVPLRLAVPGFLSARRYKAHAPGPSEGPRYAALYDLASLDVLASRAYQRLAEERSDRERAMMAKIPMVDRRVLRLVLDGAEWTADAAYQLIVCMTPPAEGEADFVEWYRKEHIGMLLEVPGWRRVRLFRQVEGEGPAFMAVHELETPDVFDHPKYEKSISTPWRQRIRASVTRYERNLFELHRG
jgi:hypothetical protein